MQDAVTITDETLLRVITQTLKEEFEQIEICDLHVVEDVDADGDLVLRVQVVFNAERKKLDTTKRLGLLRHLRPKLAEIGQDVFPVFSFIAASELKGGKAEAC